MAKRVFVYGILGMVLFSFLMPVTFAAGEPIRSAPKTYYYLTDHLGGIDKVLDAEGNVVCSNDYLPFGSPRRTDCTEQDEDYGFTGKEKDPETDLYYYGKRYYDPEIGIRSWTGWTRWTRTNAKNFWAIRKI